MIAYSHTWPGFEYPIGEHGSHQLQDSTASLSLDCMSCGGPGKAQGKGPSGQANTPTALGFVR